MKKKKKNTNCLTQKKQRSENGNHNKYSLDNVIKKLKVHLMNFLLIMINTIFKTTTKKDSCLRPINVKYIENVTKEFNIHFLNQKVFIILSLNTYNIKYIKQYFFNDRIIYIMNKKLIDIIQTYFLMESDDYKTEFSCGNEDLFENFKKNEKDKILCDIMEMILKKENSLLTYFEEIKGRKIKKDPLYKKYYQLIEKNQKLFEEYELKPNNSEIMKEFDNMIEKKEQKNLIKNLNLPLEV